MSKKVSFVIKTLVVMLVGYSDLGEINNLLSDCEEQFNTSERTPRPLGKLMLVFMVRGLFTSLKFLCIQNPAASVKGEHIISFDEAGD